MKKMAWTFGWVHERIQKRIADKISTNYGAVIQVEFQHKFLAVLLNAVL